jgi:hypothetical protein
MYGRKSCRFFQVVVSAPPGLRYEYSREAIAMDFSRRKKNPSGIPSLSRRRRSVRRQGALLGSLFVLLATPIRADGPAIAKNTEIRVRLTAPVSTQTNRKGDKVTALVVAPPEFAGAFMEGEIRESTSGNKYKGKSRLSFAFHTLALRDGARIPVSSDVRSFINSKGQQNTDEEGFLIEKKNNLGKIAITSGIGAALGALAGGARGAAIGAGIGAGAALILVQFAAQAPNIRLDPGAEIVLSVSPRRQ